MMPHSPTTSVVYALWLRSRLVLVLSLAATLGLGPVASILGPVPRAFIGTGAGMAFISGLALLIGIVTYGGADLSTPESVYPKHALVFPAGTRTLVAVPMLYGTVSVACFWLVLSALALRPAGMPLPVLWPAGMMAALVAWLQAASWSPYRVPFARIAMIILVLAVLVAIGAACQTNGVHPAAAFALSVAVGLLAYPVALRGVAKARRGDGGAVAAVPSREPVAAIASIPAKFKSASASQLWYDLIRNIWYPPAVTALVEIVLFFTFVGARQARPSVFLPAWVPPGLPPLCILLSVPVFVVMVHAIMFGKFDMWTKSLDFPPFYLTRPISSAAIIAGKLRTTAIVTALVWAVAAVVISAYALVPRTYDARHSWATVLTQHATWHGAAAIALAAVLITLFTWTQIARSLWISVSAKRWLIHGFPTASMLALCAVGWAGYRLHQNPATWQSVLANLGLVFGTFALFKVLIGVSVVFYLARRRLLTPSAAAGTLCAWLAACALLYAAILGVAQPARHAAMTVAAVVILFVPLGRPALAVLLLHYSRHR